MKKIVLSIFGIFALVACGGDVYQEEADRQIELNHSNPQNPPEKPGGNTVFTYDPGLPGNSVPGVPGVPGTYESPFSVTAGSPIMYHLINNTPYTLTITPYVGFSCYGSSVDPYWNGGIGQFTMPGLFDDGGTAKKYGNTIKIDDVVLGPGVSISHGPSTGRFPLNGASMGSSFTDSSNLPGEVGAMKELGKIYFIEYEVHTRDGIASGVLKQKFGNDNMVLPMVPGNWNYIITPPLPTIQDLTFNSDLAMVYQDTDIPGGAPGSGSMEICLVNHPGTTIVPSEVNIAGHTLSFVTSADDVYIVFQ